MNRNADDERREVQRCRKEIVNHIARYREVRKTVDVSKASALLGDLEEHRETTQAVRYGCFNIDKLLETLHQHATMKMLDVEKGEQLEQQKRQELEIAHNEVKRLRAFAADDTAMETTSVADYAADPTIPDIFLDTPFTLEAAEIAESIRKVGESLDIVFQVVEENPQWWNSAVLLRRLKTYAVRANYHARRIKGWGDHLRSHMLVTSTQLNKVAIEGTKELLEMRGQFDVLHNRKESCKARLAELEEQEREMQSELARLEAERQVLDRKLINTGRTFSVMKPDVMRCEAILFMKKLAVAVPQLKENADTVAQWVAANEFALV